MLCSVDLTGAEGELPADDAVAHAGVAFDVERTESRERSGLGVKRDDSLAVRRSGILRQADARVRKSVILQLVERRFAAGLQEREVQRLPLLQGKVCFERMPMLLGEGLEPLEDDSLNDDWIPFRNSDRDLDSRLILVGLDIVGGHACVRKAAVLVEGFDAFQIRIELLAAEVVLVAPGQTRAWNRRQHGPELAVGNCFDASELEGSDLHSALFLAGRRGCKDRQSEGEADERC